MPDSLFLTARFLFGAWWCKRVQTFMKINGLFQAGIISLFNRNDIFRINCFLTLFFGFVCQFQRIKQDSPHFTRPFFIINFKQGL